MKKVIMSTDGGKKIIILSLLLLALTACDLKINLASNLNKNSVQAEQSAVNTNEPAEKESANLNQAEPASKFVYDVVTDSEGKVLKIKDQNSETIFIADPQALCGGELMFLAHPDNQPVIIFKPFSPGSDKPFIKLYSLNLETSACQSMEISAELSDFGARVLSPDKSKIALALEVKEAKELKILDLVNDKAWSLVTLGEGETLNGGYGALSNDFQISWLDDKTLQYTVYEDTVKNYAAKIPETKEKVKEVRVKSLE